MRSNNTPFTDICTLIGIEKSHDADGYAVDIEKKSEVFCSVADGATRSEFYEALRNGIKLSITVEVWQDDYNGQQRIEYNSIKYRVVRGYPTGHGTLELSCSEVI
jgi:hypothetical protein